jgi:uncharacterized repeat protein (TIGR04052 family)
MRVLSALAAAFLSTAAAAQEIAPITLRFAAMVGAEPFACGRTYGGLGSGGASLTPGDFRFYVSDIHLIDESGKAVPLTLAQDGRWQYRDVALLDFETRSGPCLTGTAETRAVVTGTAPAGRYRGLRFTLGVPFALNHADSTIAPSPLNLTSLFWGWQGGYKFLRIDLAPAGARPAPMSHGAHAGHGPVGFPVHLGSTGCGPAGPGLTPAPCRSHNRPVIELTGFDPASGTVVADLKTLLDGVDAGRNAPGTPAGCLSAPGDADCDRVMRNLGLSFGGAPSPGQTFFRIR